MTIPKRYTIATDHSLDEFGKSQTLYVEFTCYWHVTPGQRGCHTQSNGDPGWPDDPPEAELLDVHVTKAEGEFAEIRRDSAAGIHFLDYMLEGELRQLVDDDSDGRYREAAFEAMADEDEGQKDAAADAAYERMRLGE
jgi:hypothetical protein